MDLLKLSALPDVVLEKFLKNAASSAESAEPSLQVVANDAHRDRFAIHASSESMALLNTVSANELRACIRCSKDGAFRCSGCNAAQYCSRQCQIADRKYHRRLCGQWSQFDESRRPSPCHIRCVVLRVDQPGPEFLWVKCDPEGSFSRSHIASIIPGGLSIQNHDDVMMVNQKGSTYRIDYFLAIMHQQDLVLQGAPNQAWATTVGKPGQVFHQRGNMLFTALSPPSMTQERACLPRDVTMPDWSEFVTFFLSDRSQPVLTDPALVLCPAVSAIKLNCRGDRDRYGIPSMEIVTISCMEALNDKDHHWVSPYALMLQLPWVSRWVNVNIDLVTTSSDPKEAQGNNQAAFLDASVTICPSTGGIDAIRHEPFGGTQVLFRTDGAEAHPHHLRAFNLFLGRIIPATQNSVGHVAARQGHTTISDLRSRVSKDEFVAFWKSYVADLEKEGENKKEEVPPSPYDTAGQPAEASSGFGEHDRTIITQALRKTGWKF
ncbi:hypothetical protein B0T25DRAFT_548753 [Lasiosphaeria hispida]|uniref:MYND-type domain-containing protein n=1 Tax=Lasiosphaeria hispida TaxID=260671 RepID=A0AAJ0MCJ9_9PEZI|nr:hypothetical protein B0T25DRAFT_548753 [Lasiosphaeria hispida]